MSAGGLAHYAPQPFNYSATCMLHTQILERIQSGIPQQKLHQIFVRTGKGIYLVYLDTTTQHLVYDPPVGTGPDAAANYSSTCIYTKPIKHIVCLQPHHCLSFASKLSVASNSGYTTILRPTYGCSPSLTIVFKIFPPNQAYE